MFTTRSTLSTLFSQLGQKKRQSLIKSLQRLSFGVTVSPVGIGDGRQLMSAAVFPGSDSVGDGHQLMSAAVSRTDFFFIFPSLVFNIVKL